MAWPTPFLDENYFIFPPNIRYILQYYASPTYFYKWDHLSSIQVPSLIDQDKYRQIQVFYTVENYVPTI